MAEEVRTLAARSANAAKETTELIEGSIKKVEAGTKIANDTAKALGQIVEEVEKAASLVGAIAVASKEQAVGIEQINQGIMQVSQVVPDQRGDQRGKRRRQRGAVRAAAQLKETVKVFKVKNSEKALGQAEQADMAKAAGSVPKPKNPGQISGAAGAAKAKIALSDGEFGKY